MFDVDKQRALLQSDDSENMSLADVLAIACYHGW